MEEETNIRMTAVHCAVQGGNVDCLQHLLAHGAQVNKRNFVGVTPLMIGCVLGKGAIADVLLRAGADVNAADNERRTPLIFAAARGHALVVKRLLLAGADVHAQDNTIPQETSSKKGALHYIAANWAGNSDACVEILMNAGLQVDEMDSAGVTRLAYAIQCCQPLALRKLIALGADLSCFEPAFALHVLALHGKGDVENCFDVLVGAGIDINKPNHEGMTALMCAAAVGNARAARKLLYAKADTQATFNGMTARDIAKQQGHQDVVADMDVVPWIQLAFTWAGDYVGGILGVALMGAIMWLLRPLFERFIDVYSWLGVPQDSGVSIRYWLSILGGVAIVLILLGLNIWSMRRGGPHIWQV